MEALLLPARKQIKFSGFLKNRNLELRLLSAAALVPVTLATVWVGGTIGVLVAMALAFVMFFEWTSLSHGETNTFLYRVCQLLIVTSSFLLVLQANEFAAIFWVCHVCVILFAHFLFRSTDSWQALGLLYALTFLTSLLLLRQSPECGFEATLYVLLIVWATDSFAYLGGVMIGGRKLWPAVSPKKTWAGFCSGLAAGACVGAVFALVCDFHMVMLILVAILLSLAAQAGDLFESWIKRRFNAKDSSNLIPGHGGLLDRLDSLVVASLAAYIIGALKNGLAAPAGGLLLW